MGEVISRRELLHLSRPCGVVRIDSERCTLCGACADRCPEGALSLGGAQYRLQLIFDPMRCTACEACLICPEGALHIEKIAVRESSVPAILVEDRMLRCSQCGQEIGPARLVARILKSPQELLCPPCRLVVKGIPRPFSC